MYIYIHIHCIYIYTYTYTGTSIRRRKTILGGSRPICACMYVWYVCTYNTRPIRVCMYACMYNIHAGLRPVWIHACMHVYVCVCVYIYIIHTQLYDLYGCMHVCMYIYMCVCVYIYIYNTHAGVRPVWAVRGRKTKPQSARSVWCDALHMDSASGHALFWHSYTCHVRRRNPRLYAGNIACVCTHTCIHIYTPSHTCHVRRRNPRLYAGDIGCVCTQICIHIYMHSYTCHVCRPKLKLYAD
jgi:hypothetical protein